MRRTQILIIVMCLLFTTVFSMISEDSREIHRSVIAADTESLSRFAGGDGTSGNPYLISTITELQSIDNIPNLWKHYKLINDINASQTSNWNSGAGFDPIGDSTNRFNGTFNGQGYNITSLFINRPSEEDVGLFGRVLESSISNASILNANIRGHDSVGGFVGNPYSSKISNCSSSGTVSGTWHTGGFVGSSGGLNLIKDCYSTCKTNGESNVGGFTGSGGGSAEIIDCYSTGNVYGDRDLGGFAGSCGDTALNCSSTGNVYGTGYHIGGFAGSGGIIKFCSSTGNVSGDDRVGGLLGSASGILYFSYATGNVVGRISVGGLTGTSDATVYSCFASGNVTGEENVSGLIGKNYGPLSNSYSTGQVDGNIRVGGLAGWNWDYHSGHGVISKCYSTSKISGSTFVGGLVGLNDNTIGTSFWDTETSGLSTSDGGSGLNTSDMKTKSTFTNASWDFSSVWKIIEHKTYPLLRDIPDSVQQINSDPELQTEPLTTACVNETYQVIFTANDSDADILTWVLETNATFLSINTVTGNLSGTPLKSDVGSYWVNVAVTDGYGGKDFINFSLTVYLTHPPIILTKDIVSAQVGQLYSVHYNATDADTPMQNLTWTFGTNSSWLSFPQNHTLHGTPFPNDIGTYWVNITVSDGKLFDFTNFTLTVVNRSNNPPQVKSSSIDHEIYEDQLNGELILSDLFWDVDDDPLIFSFDGNMNISVSISPAYKILLQGKSNWSGREEITFTANDSQYEVDIILNVTVFPVNDPPFNVKIENFVAEDGTNYFYLQGSANDVDINYGDTLNFTWSSNRSGILDYGTTIESLKILPEGFHTITLNVTDSKGEWITTEIDVNSTYNPNPFGDDDDDVDDDDNTINATDSDNDSLPDSWELKYFGNLSHNSEGDPDNDGLTNYQEFINNTDPTQSDIDEKESADYLSQRAIIWIIIIILILISILIIAYVLIRKRNRAKDEDNTDNVEHPEIDLDLFEDEDFSDDSLDEDLVEDELDSQELPEELSDPEGIVDLIFELRDEAIPEEKPTEEISKEEMLEKFKAKSDSGELDEDVFDIINEEMKD